MSANNENFKITHQMISNNTKIENEFMPKRIVVATNVFFTKREEDGTISLLLFNYYDNYAPYFCSHNIEKVFQANKCKDLEEEFKQGLKENNFEEKQRIIDTKKDIYNKMKIENIDIYKNNEILPDEYWIKYSVSKNVWSMYLIEHFLVKGLEKEINIKDIDLSKAIWLPVTDESIKEIISTGKYNNLQIVDTLVELLKDKNLVNNLFRGGIK